jgi:hypothetical protein
MAFNTDHRPVVKQSNLLRGKIVSAITALLTIFPILAFPAQNTEVVTPTTLWCPAFHTSQMLCSFNTDYEALQAGISNRELNSPQPFPFCGSSSCYPLITINSCNGNGTCNITTKYPDTRSSQGASTSKDVILGKSQTCPEPEHYPSIKYALTIWGGVNSCVRTIPSNLTIIISGSSSTEPWHKKHDPDHLKSNLPYKAIVKDQNGQPKANISVTITTEVTSDSGGHVHTSGRPKGKLVAGAVTSTKAGTESISGKTNGDGVFELTFGAEEVSGTHTLTAKCDSGCQAPATATVDVKVNGLEQIPGGASFYTLIDTDGTVIGSTSGHKNNHYLTSDASTILLYMASSYHVEVKYWTKPSNGKKSVPPLPLYLNDASLVWGGVFDINGDWKVDHIEHRRGSVIDIRANSKIGAIPSNNYIKFVDLAKYYGAHAKIHSPGSDNQHFHVRLLNREE